MSIILNVIARLAEGSDMRSEKEWNNKDYFSGVSVIKIALIVGLVLGIMAVFTGPTRAEDNETTTINFDKIGWPSQLIYDSANGCQRGTLNWIYSVNPALVGTLPPPPVQIAMLEHCFCVLDKIRNQYIFSEYIKFILRPEVVGRLFMSNALKCVKENGTLAGIMIIVDTIDNETKSTDNSSVIPKKQEDSEESLLDQPKEESPNEDTEPIFQG